MFNQLTILTLLLVFSNSIFAQQNTWVVTGLNGEAWTNIDKQKSPLKVNDEIPENTWVETGTGSRLQLNQGKDSLNLSQKTKIRLRKAGGEEKSNPLEFLYGRIRATVNKEKDPNENTNKTKPPRFHIRTPSAVVGVRGTEFFVQSENQTDFICTIEGLVEVESLTTQQKIMVPQNAGVKITAGAGLELNPTPEVLIDRWVNDTALQDKKTVVMDEYPFLSPTEYKWKKNIYLGLSGQLNLGYTDTLNYNATQNDDNNSFLQIRLTPALRIGEQTALTWRPWWIVHASEDPMVLDLDPVVIDDNKSQFATGELYFSHHAENAAVYLGAQSIKWNDGILFSRNFWNADPFVFPALYTKFTKGAHFVDAFYAMEGGREELNGQVPVEIFALKYDYMNWFSFYAAQRNYVNETDLPLGHEITDVGFYTNRRHQNFEYRVSGILQQGTLFKDLPIEDDSHSESAYDVGVSLYGSRRPWKLTLTRAKASENFLAGFESPYNLGYSRVFTRSNLQQTRVRISHARSHKNLYAYLEWIQYESVGTGDFVPWSGKSELAQEWDLSLQISRDSSRSALLTLFYFDPTSSLSSSSPTWSEDAGFGGILNLQWQR